jgi:hypothetical protein
VGVAIAYPLTDASFPLMRFALNLDQAATPKRRPVQNGQIPGFGAWAFRRWFSSVGEPPSDPPAADPAPSFDFAEFQS